MSFTTKFTRALGITHPIMCGGLHWVGYAQLAAAVSESGGIGLITALVRRNYDFSDRWISLEQSLTIHSNTPHQTQPSPEALQEEIRKCKSLTTKPFGVNLTLLPSLKPPNYDEFASVIEDEMKSGQLRMIETAGHFKGLAPFVKQFKEAGAYVIHKCVAIRHAKSATKLGVGTWSQNKSLSSSAQKLTSKTAQMPFRWTDSIVRDILESTMSETGFSLLLQRENLRSLSSQAEVARMDLNLPRHYVWEQRE